MSVLRADRARGEGGERFGQLGLAEAAGVGDVHSRHHVRIQDVRKRGEKGSLTLNTTAASWPVCRRQAGSIVKDRGRTPSPRCSDVQAVNSAGQMRRSRLIATKTRIPSTVAASKPR